MSILKVEHKIYKNIELVNLTEEDIKIEDLIVIYINTKI
jgi:hypothetical protein